MVVAAMGEALGAFGILAFTTAHYLRYAGWFAFGLGGFSYACRSPMAWPFLFACPVLMLASEIAECLGGHESLGECILGSSLVLLWLVGFAVGWAYDRRRGDAA